MNNKVLLYSTGNYIQYPVINHNRKNMKKNVYNWRWRWSCSVVSDSLWPYRLWPTRLFHPWDFPGKSIGVGGHFLLQRIFPTQGSNTGLPHCRQTLYRLSHQGSLYITESLVNQLYFNKKKISCLCSVISMGKCKWPSWSLIIKHLVSIPFFPRKSWSGANNNNCKILWFI